MEYNIELQQDKTGQRQRWTRICLQQLQLVLVNKQEPFFQKSAWLHATMPYSIYEILDELEYTDVCTIIALRHI